MVFGLRFLRYDDNYESVEQMIIGIFVFDDNCYIDTP